MKVKFDKKENPFQQLREIINGKIDVKTVEFDSSFNIFLTLEGTRYDATIPTSVMRVALDLESEIKKICKGYEIEIDKDFELFVRVDKGSSLLELKLDTLYANMVGKMSGTQITIVAVLGILSFLAYKIIKNRGKVQIEKDKADFVKAIADTSLKNNQESLAVAEKSIDSVVRVAEKLIEATGRANSASINGDAIDQETIANFTESRAKEKEEQKETAEGRLDGKFSILTADFSNEDDLKMKISNKQNPALTCHLQQSEVDEKSLKSLFDCMRDRKVIALEMNVVRKLSDDSIVKATVLKIGSTN